MATADGQCYVSDEYAQVVWASHILSYLNPYTCSKTDGPKQTGRMLDASPEDGDEEEDDDDDYDDEMDDCLGADLIATGAGPHPLAVSDEPIRQKFLNCIAELLAHKKGGKYVAATALREKEDSVEIDIASNSPFKPSDEEYLACLVRFLGERSAEEGPPTDGTLYGADGACHSLLELTVIRNASRVDWWQKELAKLGGGTVSPIGGPPLCNQPCQEETQLPVRGAVTELVTRVCNSSSAARGGGLTLAGERLRVVRLAAIVTRSAEAASAELKRMIPSIDGSKAVRLCRLMARPETNLRTLAHIAYLLPNFRTAVFVTVPPPGRTRLGSRQILSFEEAWNRLGLPKSDRPLPRSLTRRKKQFRKDCCRAFPVHCDAQLLLRYEADPSLRPSLPYVGCSKKACFLCHGLLSALSFQPKLRGHHGLCHPLWGIGATQPESLRRQLRQLCETVKEKIVSGLAPRRSRPVTAAIPQTSAVSGLGSADMIVLRRQSASREMLEQKNQELRQRLQIL